MKTHSVAADSLGSCFSWGGPGRPHGNRNPAHEFRGNVADGMFTVPAYILSALPAGSGGAGFQDTFGGTLTATGLDYTTAGGLVSFSVAGTYK
jgi:hypothetical protein